MDRNTLNPIAKEAIKEIIGYLNFSSGASDAKFLRNLNAVFKLAEEQPSPAADGGQTLRAWLKQGLQVLPAESPAFRNVGQAQAVISLAFDNVLPAYLAHHRDLLFHQTPAELVRPFFLGRLLEAILLEGGPWDEVGRIISGSLRRLNDYIGYRPVAVLETEQKIEPYPNERLRPVPLYIAGAGVAVGRYHDLIDTALTILRETPPEVLQAAWLDPALLDELAFDPRAYDFDHPVNKRPNYHFGQWDPHHLDNQGRYRRFVLQQVCLDALLERVDQPAGPPHGQRLFEAAAVLAGTILMASGTSGSGPDTHDSSLTLTMLLPRIAAYRDAFYSKLLDRVPSPHAERLRAEAATLRQPFGAARQQLNQQLAKRRAWQVQHVNLAMLFARMGFPESAMRQAQMVPVAAARMVCQMQCHLVAGFTAARRGELSEAAACLPKTEDLLHRAIECGALIDPWNIIGFGGQFSIFPAMENSVPDPRVDDLIDLMEQIFSLYARVWREAAAVNDEPLSARLKRDFFALTSWWDRFAVPMVSSVKRLFGMELLMAAEYVAGALNAWHLGGAAAGDTAFWRPFAELFDSPKAYAAVVDALLEKRDFVAAMALLVHWVGQAERVKLEAGDSSFHKLAVRWMEQVLRGEVTGGAGGPKLPDERRALARKFLDFLEANAEAWWEVPQLELDAGHSGDLSDLLSDAEDDEDDEDLFGAAYDDMIYRDSTADGFEGEMLEAGSSPSDYELDFESKRLAERLAFLATVARLLKVMALSSAQTKGWGSALQSWHRQTSSNRRRLLQLLRAVHGRQIPVPSANQEAMVEYDRRRMVRDALLERIIATTVATWDAERITGAALDASGLVEHEPAGEVGGENARALWRALVQGEVAAARALWPLFLETAGKQALLYLPLAKGGDPARIVVARSWQLMLRQLLAWLPRAGLLRETCQLIGTARAMERDHPLGPGAVTEFDRLFEVGVKSLVESIVDAALHWSGENAGRSADEFDGDLIECLRQLTEGLLSEWLGHSRTLRLSVLERAAEDREWTSLVQFIQQYGKDVFTQKFFNLGNLRAILYQGVGVWLEQMEADPDRPPWRLFEDLDVSIPRAEAVQQLSLVIEAVIENYGEYRDYNSTTTQSDRGDMLYMLLDFLRLKAAYERVNWNLRPVVMAHEVLVRRGRNGAAEIWRRAMTDRTSLAAAEHLTRLSKLQAEYAMRLATVFDRISERFVRPLTIDRLRALVKPAVEEARQQSPPTAFALLEQEATELAQQPMGAGLDIPDWLTTLEDEVTRVCSNELRGDESKDSFVPVARVILTFEEIQDQLTHWHQA